MIESTEETLTKLNGVIEDLRMFQEASSSSFEFERYDGIIKQLNEVYDTLVLIGG